MRRARGIGFFYDDRRRLSKQIKFFPCLTVKCTRRISAGQTALLRAAKLTTNWKPVSSIANRNFSVAHPVQLHLAAEDPINANGVGNHHRHTDARDDEHDAERFRRR
jgi:hypothetical protein